MDKSLLPEAFDRLEIGYDDAVLSRFDAYLGEIMLFNPTYKLVAQNDEDEIVIRHFIDSAAAMPYMASLGPKTIADLGSGAGFPGVVLAILMPDTKFTLVERMSRRVSFLRNVIARLALDNVEIADCDAKRVAKTFDVVTARAYHPVYDCFDEMERLVSDSGHIVLYKGPEKNAKSEAEVLQRNKKIDDCTIIHLQVPFLDEARSLLVLR